MSNPSKTSDAADPLVLVRVIITPTVIGDLRCAAGAELRIPKSEAETLAALTPPPIEIIGG